MAATVVVASMFAPWVRSGSALRSSFATLRTADRLGTLDGGGLRLLSAVWVCLPVVGALLGLASVAGRQRAVVALGLVLGLVAGAGAVLVRAADLSSEWGTTVALIGSVALVTAVLATPGPTGRGLSGLGRPPARAGRRGRR